jgi:hypothetical protein
MAEDIAARAEQLAIEFIAPMVHGGPVVLQRPFGAELALRIGEGRRIVDGDTLYATQAARLQILRHCLPADTIAELRPSEWTLACAFNDLLQATNHELSSAVTRPRHMDLLTSVNETCAHIPNPATLGEALARHATFHNVIHFVRHDQSVRWWTGSEYFRGQAPSARLLAWPDLRQVKISPIEVPFWEMCDESVPMGQEEFLGSMRSCLGRSPLTDLAHAGRDNIPFAWTAASLGIVANPVGSNLARRAILNGPWTASQTAESIDRANQLLTSQVDAMSPAAQIATQFLQALQPNGSAAR